MKKTKSKVRAGQVWLLGTMKGGRWSHKEVRVKKVSRETVVVRHLDGREHVVSRRTMERGFRQARLLRENARSAPKPAPRVALPSLTRAEQKTASELARAPEPPRGLVKVHAVDARALELREKEGLSWAVIGERLGMPVSSVKRRLERARDAQRDAKFLSSASAGAP